MGFDLRLINGNAIFFFFTTHKNNFFLFGKNPKIALTYFCNVLTDSWRCYKVPSQSTVIIRLWGCWFHRWREEKKRRASMMALLFSRSWRCSLLRKECHELVLNCTYMTWFQSAKTDPNFFFLYIRILALKEKNRGKLRKEKNRVDYVTTEILRLGWVYVYEDNWSGEAPISFQSLRRNMGRLKRKQHRSRTEISFSRFNTYINWE